MKPGCRFVPWSLMFVFALCSQAICIQVAWGQSDRVYPLEGRTLVGDITEISPEGVTIDSGGRRVTVAVTNLRMVNFADEPRDVTGARRAIAEDRWNNAMQLLETINVSGLSPEGLATDVEYMVALCTLKMAISGEQGTLDEASAVMAKFVADHAESYHQLEAVSLLGDVLLARGEVGRAEGVYARLVNDFQGIEVQQQGRLKMARVQELQGKSTEALENYQLVQQVESATPESQQAKLVARVGEARCRAELGEVQESIATLEQLIVNESSSNVALFAEVYNSLGSCYRLAKQPKQAINAYLHTDLLFYQNPVAHAEALYRLGELFASVDKFEESARAREKLKSRYPTSPWSSRPTGER